MSVDRSESGSDLPAPYEDPWLRLAIDLRAVVASLRLRLRELWRRNAQADLPRPAAWPARLAPLFWPLVGGAALALVLALVVAVGPRLAGGFAGAGAPPAAPRPELPAAGGDPPDLNRLDSRNPGPVAPGSSLPSPLPELAPTIPEIAAETLAPMADSPPSGPPEAGGGDTTSQVSAPLSPATEPVAPPLLGELVGDDPPSWILGLEARPADSLLRLRLDAGFRSLEGGAQRDLANTWLGRSRALGYERLELLDLHDQLLARTARVGSGMILLDSLPSR